MATEQIVIEYIAQVEGLKAQLKTVQAEIKKVQTTAEESSKGFSKSFSAAADSIKGAAVNIAASLGVAFSVQKVVQFAQESIKAFEEAEAASKKLEFAVTKIGKEGAAAFEKLTKQADKLSKITIFDDESIRGAQTMLAQFGLQSKEIEKLIPRIIDLASATGQDLSSATQLAIAGINGQGRALKPYGIILDDTGDKTENLAILTEGLTKFTGSAGEAFNTAAGQAKFFDNQINELQESIGEKLAPAWAAVKLAALNAIEAQLSVFDDTNEAKFQKLLDTYQSKSAETQTKILFDLAQKGNERTELEQRLYLEYKKFQELRLSDDASGLGLTQAGIDAKIAAEKKAADDLAAAQKKALDAKIAAEEKANNELIKVTQDHIKDVAAEQAKEEKEVAKQLQDNVDLKIELAGDVRDAEIKANEEAIAEASRLYDEDVENKKKAAEQKQAVTDAGVELFSASANALFEYQNQLDQQQLDNFKGSEEQKAVLEKELSIKRAKRDRDQAIFNIIIDTAQAVVRALATGGIPLSIIVGALGAVQLAAVLAKPIPKFAEGVIDLKGGVAGKDSIPSLLMPGESVMRTDITKEHGGLLKAMHENRFNDYLMENYINPRLSDILGGSTADNMAKSAKLNGLNEYSLSRVMSRNKGVNVQNADYIAKAIAREMRSDNVKRTWSA